MTFFALPEGGRWLVDFVKSTKILELFAGDWPFIKKVDPLRELPELLRLVDVNFSLDFLVVFIFFGECSVPNSLACLKYFPAADSSLSGEIL